MADSGPLCSSPARPTLHDRLMMLSSSPLPDIQELIARKPRTHKLKSGSAAAPIPAHANTTFTRASDLLAAQAAAGDDSFDPIDEQEPLPAKKAPAKRPRKPAAKVAKLSTAPKRVAKEVIVLSSDGVTPDGAQPENSNAAEAQSQKNEEPEDSGVQGTPLKAKPWKKYKVAGERSPTTEKEEVVEAVKASENTKKPRAQKKEPKTVNRRSLDDTGAVENPRRKEKPSRVATPEPMNLELAVQRRLDWTPPRQDPTFAPTENGHTWMLSDGPAPEDEDTYTVASDVFKKLHDTFGHKLEHEKQPEPQQQPANILGKSKVIDLIPINHPSEPTEPGRKPSPVKEKAPKKKPRTITELATAPYVVKNDNYADDHNGEDSLLEYFRADGPNEDTTKATGGKGKGRAAKVTKSRKNAQPKKPVLLSPRAAMKRSAAQDFVFGTSSQLAREKSPTLLKDLHEALKASITTDEDDPFGSSGEAASKPERPAKGLWSVSARDQAGEMVNVEIIDLVDSSGFPEDDAILDPWKQLTPEPVPAESGTTGTPALEFSTRRVIADEDAQSRSSVPTSTFSTTQRKITINTAAVMKSPPTTIGSFPLLTDLLEDEMPPPSNQQQTQEDRAQPPSSRTGSSPQKPRPKFELFTDAKLAKEVSKFGFKAVKTRNAMISLLDQCWRSKNQPLGHTAAFSTNSSVLNSPKRKQPASSKEDSAASVPPAKKPRGRPKKAATMDVDGAGAGQETELPKNARQGDESATPKKRGRHRKKDAAAAATAAEKAAASMPPPSPKPRRGTSTPKRKKVNRSIHEVQDSDLDSEGEIGVSSSPEQPFSPAGDKVSISDDTEISLNLSPSEQQSALYDLITRAVTSAPRTSDPSMPSWHEKMLMYDPIILEDLTAWLNSGQLTRVGHDGEISPLAVKKWCESRSICCLWKVNVRGKERKRF
ncbi:hypothetical protein M406DRAFT_330598 [Cryphonectria parasitica EP155]|uniref:Structure-specific endonuclease subunit SLX4 n=1 Tax=Cryphonectria parasitica (strain ATCC 38755 / EP155) TaxID=660469 RepID=A0A9P5CNF0_CRYP1|nr:uncharacterized protein M406DRAFT_330598 [Cryphonectria parasitica EP155]KAF3764252.1 hypothetical protein M406DRAFT_330598 [Cryphonectria parasitica EP155]